MIWKEYSDVKTDSGKKIFGRKILAFYNPESSLNLYHVQTKFVFYNIPPQYECVCR